MVLGKRIPLNAFHYQRRVLEIDRVPQVFRRLLNVFLSTSNVRAPEDAAIQEH